MLGHKSAAMTLDTYSDLFPDDLDAVAALLDEAVRAQVCVICGWIARRRADRERAQVSDLGNWVGMLSRYSNRLTQVTALEGLLSSLPSLDEPCAGVARKPWRSVRRLD